MRNKLKIIKTLILVIIVISGSFTYYYGYFIAPNKYVVKRTTVTNNSLPKQFKNFEIGFISDINLQDKNDVTRLEQIVTRLNKENVDMIIFGGDLFQSTPFDNEKVIKTLSNIKSRYGKFAVLGEKDLASLNDTTGILNEGGFEVLHNEYRPIYLKDEQIGLFGLESNGDIRGLINETNQKTYKLIAVHEPDYFDLTTANKIALQLSGHTMGGYIHLPGLNGLFKKTNGTNYVSGKHIKNGSQLIISNGLGMEEDHSFRLFCPNQINIITLQK